MDFCTSDNLIIKFRLSDSENLVHTQLILRLTKLGKNGIQEYCAKLRDSEKRLLDSKKRVSNLEPKTSQDPSTLLDGGKTNPCVAVDGKMLPTRASWNYKGLIICKC